jgi:nitroreductase
MKYSLFEKGLVLGITILFFGICIVPSTETKLKNHILKNDEICCNLINLPTPDFTNSNLERSICRRMSVRDFNDSSVSDQDLSNILWAAYGYTINGKRTIHSPNRKYSVCIYVIRKDGTYKYAPETHSLSLFRFGDYTFIGQYDTAPIKLGLVWDRRTSCDENMAWAEVGMIGQNIYFEANALNLGTVTTASYVNQLYLLGLSIYEKPVIIMPLGHPLNPYDFTYDPLPPSNLPPIVNNSMGLENVIINRSEITIWNDEPLSSLEQSQIIWASYGYSYLFDNVNNKRHRTVPSSHGKYPLLIFAANHTGIYQYDMCNHSIIEIAQGDRRIDINEVTKSDAMVSSAPWILISFLDINLVNPDNLQAWYYEAGAIAHNVFLESTAMNLRANIVINVDNDALRSALEIQTQTNLLPLFIMLSGRTNSSNSPEKPIISGPTSGKAKQEYTYRVVSTDPDGDNISYWVEWGDNTTGGWTEFAISGVEVTTNHSWSRGSYEIKAKARDINGAESDWTTLEVSMQKNKMKHQINILFERFIQLFPVFKCIILYLYGINK